MSTSTITVVHCDFPGCDERAEQFDARTMPGGWTGRIYTHGCPDHGEAIAAHAATIESETIRRKDWWSLRCACGWTPPRRAAWSSSGLREQHREHLTAALTAEEATPDSVVVGTPPAVDEVKLFRVKSEHGVVTQTWHEAATGVVHRCPPGDDAVMPCCGRSPFDVPDTDRMAIEDGLVTCDPGALIEEPDGALELSTERSHLIETTTYDADLHPVAARFEPKPGLQFGNGHPVDCRCLTCRPDILRWPTAPDLYEQGGHLDGEFADERGKFDPLIGEQGEGEDRG